jgi:hypothetical protein
MKTKNTAPEQNGEHYKVTLEEFQKSFFIPREQHTDFDEIMQLIGKEYPKENIGRIVIDIW